MALWASWNFPPTYDHWPQHGDEGAEPAALFDQRLADGLLLGLLQQQVLVVDVLERAVQLWLDVAPPCERQGQRLLKQRPGRPPPSLGCWGGPRLSETSVT